MQYALNYEKRHTIPMLFAVWIIIAYVFETGKETSVDATLCAACVTDQNGTDFNRQ